VRIAENKRQTNKTMIRIPLWHHSINRFKSAWLEKHAFFSSLAVRSVHPIPRRSGLSIDLLLVTMEKRATPIGCCDGRHRQSLNKNVSDHVLNDSNKADNGRPHHVPIERHHGLDPPLPFSSNRRFVVVVDFGSCINGSPLLLYYITNLRGCIAILDHTLRVVLCALLYSPNDPS
jgi:hypothetical protein